MENTSAAICVAHWQTSSKLPTRPQVTSALAPIRASADSLGAPPEQRQRRRDHSRAQHAKEGQYMLDDVGELDADDGVGRQPDPRSRAAIAVRMRSAWA